MKNRPDELLKLLVSASRLQKVLTTPGDFQLLMKHMKLIPKLDDFSIWLKNFYDTRETNEFKKVINYLKNESKFLKNKNSSKYKIIDSHIESLEKAQAFMMYSFYCLLDEIRTHEENIVRNVLLDENLTLRNLLSAFNIHFNEVNISETTSRFIRDNRKDFIKIDRKTINDVEEWLNEYKEKHGKVPKTVTQLKKFINKK